MRAIALAVLCLVSVGAVGAASAPDARNGATMSERAKGTFEVKVTPSTDDWKDRVASGRLTIDKTFHGDLVGTSKGEMWTADTAVKGSGGYVAVEKISGTLRGRRGTFLVVHQGTMRQGGDFKISIVVVPDSGTDQLTGLAGQMTIVIADGKHSYELEYALPAAAEPVG